MTNQPHVALDAKALEAAIEYVKSQSRLWHAEAKRLDGFGRYVDGGRFEYQARGADEIVKGLAALSQNPGTSNTSGEAVGVRGLEWSRDDVGNDVATTICGPYVVWTEGIGAVGYWSLGYGGVRTQAPDRAAAKAAAQADYEQRILAALEPRASDRGAVTDEMVRAGAFAAWASTTPFAGLTEAAFRAKSDQHVRTTDLGGGTTLEQDMLLDWELNVDTFCVLARATLEASIRKLSEVSHEH